MKFFEGFVTQAFAYYDVERDERNKRGNGENVNGEREIGQDGSFEVFFPSFYVLFSFLNAGRPNSREVEAGLSRYLDSLLVKDLNNEKVTKAFIYELNTLLTSSVIKTRQFPDLLSPFFTKNHFIRYFNQGQQFFSLKDIIFIHKCLYWLDQSLENFIIENLSEFLLKITVIFFYIIFKGKI